jgi:hypothetical protein
MERVPQTSAPAEVVMGVATPAQVCPTAVGLACHVDLDGALSRRYYAHEAALCRPGSAGYASA